MARILRCIRPSGSVDARQPSWVVYCIPENALPPSKLQTQPRIGRFGWKAQQATALANEIRTPALWGLRFRRPLLHDGSAATPLEAILRHGNEAQTATTNYRELPTPDQDALLAFLDSL